MKNWPEKKKKEYNVEWHYCVCVGTSQPAAMTSYLCAGRYPAQYLSPHLPLALAAGVRVAFVCVRDESFSHSNDDAMNRYFRRSLAFESLKLQAAGPLGPGAHLLLLSVEVTAPIQLVHGPSIKCASHLHSSNF